MENVQAKRLLVETIEVQIYPDSKAAGAAAARALRLGF